MISKFFYFLFLYSSIVYGSYLSIEDLDDCSRVSGNISTFWKANKSLIPKISKSQPLSEEDKISVIKNDNYIVQDMIREFASNKSKFYTNIESSLSYTSEYKADITENFGKVMFNNLNGGLKALKELIANF